MAPPPIDGEGGGEEAWNPLGDGHEAEAESESRTSHQGRAWAESTSAIDDGWAEIERTTEPTPRGPGSHLLGLEHILVDSLQDVRAALLYSDPVANHQFCQAIPVDPSN